MNSLSEIWYFFKFGNKVKMWGDVFGYRLNASNMKESDTL
jgi:hypothetical protein